MVAGPILAVYCIQLLLTITCPFSKYFQILYIFDQIFKFPSLFSTFLCPSPEKSLPMPLLSRIGPGCTY